MVASSPRCSTGVTGRPEYQLLQLLSEASPQPALQLLQRLQHHAGPSSPLSGLPSLPSIAAPGRLPCPSSPWPKATWLVSPSGTLPFPPCTVAPRRRPSPSSPWPVPSMPAHPPCPRAGHPGRLCCTEDSPALNVMLVAPTCPVGHNYIKLLKPGEEWHLAEKRSTANPPPVTRSPSGSGASPPAKAAPPVHSAPLGSAEHVLKEWVPPSGKKAPTHGYTS